MRSSFVRSRPASAQTEYTPIGHTVNLASRMQSLANAGAIVISDSTRKLVEGYFELRSLGPARLKGISDSVRLYEVAGLGPLRTRLERSAGRGLSKFVGRSQEKTELPQRCASLREQGRGGSSPWSPSPASANRDYSSNSKPPAEEDWTVMEAFSVSHGKASPYLAGDRAAAWLFRDHREATTRPVRREKVAERDRQFGPSLEDSLPYLYTLLEIDDDKERLARNGSAAAAVADASRLWLPVAGRSRSKAVDVDRRGSALAR